MRKINNEIWVGEKELLKITQIITQGANTRVLGNGYEKQFLSVEINGERFIPESNATRNANRIAELLRLFLIEEK
jgi:hypothetical protein